jgi:hypothetical protein
MEWRWHDEVPEELALLRGQWLRTAGVQHWHGWDFIMLDFCEPGAGRYFALYAACPDWRWHYIPVGTTVHGTGHWD